MEKRLIWTESISISHPGGSGSEFVRIELFGMGLSRQVQNGSDNERILFSTDNGGWDWSSSIRLGSPTAWTGRAGAIATQCFPGSMVPHHFGF